MKQLNLRVEDQIAEAFYRFCEKVQVKPYELLGAIVGLYARAQILSEKVERQELDQTEALIELGRIVADMKGFAKANGEFKLAVGDMLKPYGVTLGELGLS